MPGEGIVVLLAQREFEVGLAGIEAGLGEGALQRLPVALEEIERFGAIDGEARVDGAGGVDMHPHIDAAESRADRGGW